MALRSEFRRLRLQLERRAEEASRSKPRQEIEQVAGLIAAMLATMPQEPGEAAHQSALDARQMLPRRWAVPQKGIRFHAAQAAARASSARHRLIEAARRSGKTEDRKREIVIRALDPAWPGWAMGLSDRFTIVGAPTQAQTERIYLHDLRRLIPPQVLRNFRLSPLPTFELINGAFILLCGMDKPERFEGFPTDDVFLDEFANMKPTVWEDHLSFSLETPGRPPGMVTIYGTPDLQHGLHFADLADRARELMEDGNEAWSYHHWSARGIIGDEQWEAKKATSDPKSFGVEMEAKRVHVGDLVYHQFAEENVVPELRCIPSRPLIICCDFNTDPGTAVLLQEHVIQDYTEADELPDSVADRFTAVLDEVFIRRTTTVDVMDDVLQILEELGHQGKVLVYGDASGGAGGSAKIAGSDIELIRKVLAPKLGKRLGLRFKRRNPPVFSRVCAVNARLCAADGFRRLLIKRRSCKELIRDFESVSRKKARKFDIEKPSDAHGKLRTHLSDGIGYYLEREFPAKERKGGSSEIAM